MLKDSTLPTNSPTVGSLKLFTRLGLQNDLCALQSKNTLGYCTTDGLLGALTPTLRTGRADSVGSKLIRLTLILDWKLYLRCDVRELVSSSQLEGPT